MSQLVLDPARLIAEGDALWAIGHRVEASVRSCEAALADTGGMAGDEDTARVFALGDGGEPGYDGSARQVLGGALEVVNALRSMDAALANTARAYDGAQLAGAYREPAASRFRAQTPSLVLTDPHLPSALGPGPTTPLGEFGEFLTDALAAIGVVLPDADPGKIDRAETAWTDLASALRRVRAELDTSLHAAVSTGVPQHARIASCRDGIARRIDTAAGAADGLAGYARALGDAVARAWEEIGWFIAQMVAEIAIEIGVGVLLSSVTFGAGAIATMAKIAFTVARWAIKIAEVCQRLTAVMRAALGVARISARGAAHLVKDSIAAGVAGVAAQIGYNELRAAIDPEFARQGFGDILAGGLIAAAVPAFPGMPASAADSFVSPGARTAAEFGIDPRISYQRQGRHVLDALEYDEGSYLRSHKDAQQVLDEFHDGTAEVLGVKPNGNVVIRSPTVTGINVNPGSGFANQETNVFFIKGTKSVSVVPDNPEWKP
ncbi:polymorphic toxin type 50 domain-containing protein [Agromyces sp. MMS24-K17]|uniref:polymorphic toxin type 50 domain-containing protein n=1 Tax=Agromyces sp. MMS24-K17 TaxID=3372850 RepID=UPI0037549F06